jgi:cation diffusion facilitator family transporter
MNRGREKKKVAFYSVLVGLFLTGIKLAVGLMTGSLGILSEALHSLLDLGAALLTFFSVRFSLRPPDDSHPYGHGKIENLSALAQALLLLATCDWIVVEAIKRLAGKHAAVEASLWAFLVMAVSLALDIFISRVLHRAARKYSSQALEADALHYGSDILSSGVVIAGLVGVRLGIPALDPIAALGVALLVTLASVRLSRRAVEELLDRAPRGLSEKIRTRLDAMTGVGTVERIRVRRSGASTFIDLVVSAGRSMSLDRSHRLADTIEGAVREIVPESDVLVHFHPTSDGESFVETVRATALACCPPVQEIHDVRSYMDEQSGKYFLSMHVRLDPALPLDRAHALVDTLETDLKKKVPRLGTIEIHLETSETVGDGRRSAVPAGRLAALQEAFARHPHVREIHDVFLHQISEGSLISCHVVTVPSLSLQEAHDIASAVEEKIKELFPEAVDVVVHTEPDEAPVTRSR